MKPRISSMLRSLRTGDGAEPYELTFIAILIAIVPLVSTGFLRDVVLRAAIMAIFAVSLDFAWGQGGVLSLGHAAFFGIGGYGVALAAKSMGAGFGLVLGLLAGMAVAGLLAAGVGWFVFWAKNVTPFYIAIVTIALSFLAQQLALRFQFTGGANGIPNIPGLWGRLSGYYLVVVVLVVIGGLVYIVSRSDFGRLMAAIRENELRTRFLGYKTSLLRLLVFCASAAMAAFAGGLYATTQAFVSPSLLAVALSTQVIVWVAIGGRGRVIGAVIGALLINILTPYLLASFAYLWQIFIGAVFVIAVLFVPNGLYSYLRPRSRRQYVGRTYQLEVIPDVADEISESESQELLAIQDVELAFGRLKVLRGVNLKVFSRELHCLIGPNGAGKSTLVNVVTGLLRASPGRVSKGEDVITRDNPERVVRRRIARTFQSSAVFESLEVGEILQLASYGGTWPSRFKRSKTIRVTEATAALLRVSQLDQKLGTRAADLSHGERKLLELGMAAQLDPDVLFLDEPTAGLSSVERNEIGEVLRYLSVERGVALVVIEHDMTFVRAIADRISVLCDGAIAIEGSVSEVAESEVLRCVYLGEVASDAGLEN